MNESADRPESASRAPEFENERPATEALDARTERDPTDPDLWLSLFESSDDQLARALSAVRGEIRALGALYAKTLRSTGRVVLTGAGTSGRLAFLDAAEWPPTFGIEPGRVIARIAGGPTAFERAVEGAEDVGSAGAALVDELALDAADLLVGISASGSAKFVAAAVATAARRGAATARLTCATPPAWPAQFPGETPPAPPLDITLPLGAELVAGSTRLSAATGTHRVLQRASVLCALELGWIYRGRMVEMRPTNQKLRRRAAAIVAELSGRSEEEARTALASAHDDIKVAILTLVAGVDRETADAELAGVGRNLREIPAIQARFEAGAER